MLSSSLKITSFELSSSFCNTDLVCIKNFERIYKDVNGMERTGLWEEGKRVAWLDDDDYGEQMDE